MAEKHIVIVTGMLNLLRYHKKNIYIVKHLKKNSSTVVDFMWIIPIQTITDFEKL